MILKSIKIQSNLWRVCFFQIEAFLSLKNARSLPIFFLYTRKHLLISLYIFKPRKNIPLLVGTTHKKPEYLKMRKTNAQYLK